MLLKWAYFLVGVFLSSSAVDGANILGLLGMTSPSSQIWNNVLLYKLAEKGHNVTILSVDALKPGEKVPPTVHHIHLEKGYAMYGENKSDEKVDILAYMNLSPFESIVPFYDFGVETCKGIVASKGLQTLLDYPDDYVFDLILHDYTLGPYLLGFVHKFHYPPLVGLTAFHNSPLTIDAMFNHYFPAYIPYHSTTFSTEMDFWQRLQNTLLFIADTAYRRLVYVPQIDAIMRPYFAKDMPYLGDLSAHTTLSFVNSHPAIDYPEALPPNVIEVGGMQILDPKPLPKDLDEFMNKSRSGAVFISFGTNVKSEALSEEKKQAMVSAMSQLPQFNFLWKFDVKYLKGKLPRNVMTRSFFPQRDILAHPKIKAFVTHCGGLSSQEATWRGVPMVGVPLFLDQHRNLQQSLVAGVAVKIDFNTMTAEVLRDAIKNVTENPVIVERMRIRSRQFRDQPMKPVERAVWWVEYLLRNPNPYHLKSPAAELNIFQANSLDVLLALWTVFVMLIYLLFRVVVVALRKIRGAVTLDSSTKKLKTK